MEVRMVSTPSAETDNEPVRCDVAIELSKSSWIVGFQTPLTSKTSQYQVKACDASAMLELIEQVRTRELRRPIEVMSCYEAGYDGRQYGRACRRSRPYSSPAKTPPGGRRR
jgi:transposase